MATDYNPIANDFDAYRDDSVTDTVLGYGTVLTVLGSVHGKKMLDYGCGSGQFCQQLTGMGAKTIGVDTSEAMIEVAKKHYPHLTFNPIASGDLSGFADKSFDAVTSNFVFCAIPSSEELNRIFQEIYRTLRPDGQLVVLDSNRERSHGKNFLTFQMDELTSFEPGARTGGTLKGPNPIRVEDYYWPVSFYRQVLSEIGFRTILVEEPLATDDQYPWLDEKQYPPFFILKAQK